jgi:phospholipase/carboxylesterase
VHEYKLINTGKNFDEADKVLIMIHGRGASAEDILSLAPHLNISDYALIAPQATNHSWYPFSFLAAPKKNEPWLSSALGVVNKIVNDTIEKGKRKENIYFLGFSQGACLTLEYVTRNAGKYGGVVAFTGGLIGDKIYNEKYIGDFLQTPVFIGSSNPDPHVPVERVYATVNILKDMNASVTEKIYDNMGHTISQDEIDNANNLVFSKEKTKA